MNTIEVKGLTKDYGHGRGIYDVTFEVKEGETLGFLGPNGAGKSTTMRHLMGFSKPHSGEAFIDGISCWSKHSDVMANVGYLPGEVAIPDGLTGSEFLDMMSGLRGGKDSRREELIELFKVNLEGSVKKMSIGEKRKLAVVAAFMSDPEVLLLDEPTSGLDPIMQEIFIEFVKNEKKRGKTILLSSHIFSEVEALCDRIAIIKEGKIVSVIAAEEITHYKRKSFDIEFGDTASYNAFLKGGFDVKAKNPGKLTLSVAAEDSICNQLIRALSNLKIKGFTEHSQTLEDYFMNFYKSNRQFSGI